MVSRLPHRAALVLLLAVAGLCLLAGTASASQWASAEQRLVDKINAERRAYGQATLGVDAELQRVARDWSAVMARDDRLYHNPNLGTQVQRDWQRIGENVGWVLYPGSTESALVDRVHSAFMGSSGHRANVLRAEYNWVGVGIRVTSAGKLWATVTFMQGAGSPPPPAPPPRPLGPGEFRDVNGGTHAPAIKAIALRGVTKGCTAELFCPHRQVTRGQLASFIVRARNLPLTSRDYFVDDRGSVHESAINAVAAAGITNGCSAGVFCADAPVSRSQMASFLQRAWNLPNGTGSYFVDVGPTVHALAINAIADAQITVGCGTGLFCPNKAVTRAEMASFLGRALGIV